MKYRSSSEQSASESLSKVNNARATVKAVAQHIEDRDLVLDSDYRKLLKEGIVALQDLLACNLR
jgi:hypothetical protein